MMIAQLKCLLKQILKANKTNNNYFANRKWMDDGDLLKVTTTHLYSYLHNTLANINKCTNI